TGAPVGAHPVRESPQFAVPDEGSRIGMPVRATLESIASMLPILPVHQRPRESRMKATRILLVLALCIGTLGAQAEENVPIEAFVGSDLVRLPRLSTDGKHFAVSLNLGEGRHA